MRSSEFLLFLGAGTSTPFGVPTMSQMAEEFDEYIGKRPQEALYQEITLALKQLYNRYDIETVLSVIQGLRSPSYVDPYEAFIFHKVGKERLGIITPQLQQSASELEKTLVKFILEKCDLNKNKYEQKKGVYDKLFAFLGEVSPQLKIENKLRLNIYTTNYDRYLDRYLNDTFAPNYNSAVKDYFEQSGEEAYLRLNESYFTSEYVPSDQFVKLHGSVNWYKSGAGKVVRTLEPLKDYEENRVMIYPTNDKPLYLEPWVSLLVLFRNALDKSKNWIVMGYSFNDEYLRGVFEEKLKSGDHRLVIIGKEGKKIAKTRFKGNKSVLGLKCEFDNLKTCVDDVQQWFKT